MRKIKDLTINNMNDPPDFQKILKAKRDYYGNTEGAIECAAENYAKAYEDWRKTLKKAIDTIHMDRY